MSYLSPHSPMSPANGPIIGDTRSRSGSDFEPGISKAGTRAAQQVAVVSSSLIQPWFRWGAATLVDVSVEDVYGAVNTLLGGFEYTSLVGEPPLLTGIVPTQGSVREGNCDDFRRNLKAMFRSYLVILVPHPLRS